MNNGNFDKSIDLDKIKELSKESTNEDSSTTDVVGANWMEKLNENESKRNGSEVEQAPIIDKPEQYNGPGLIVTQDEIDAVEAENPQPKYTGITPDTQSNIDNYLEQMDKDYEEAKEFYDEKQKELKSEENVNTDDDDEDNSDMTKDEFSRKYEDAVVLIDKTGLGSVINFTDEEREKLEKSKRIKLEEVETVSLETIKTKKMKKRSDLNTIIKRRTSLNTTNIVLPISGYTATIGGCSAYEVLSLIEPTDTNTLIKMQGKWSIIHSKIESTSIGDMDFNEFLLNTATADYETLLYGLWCATYPDEDTMTITCEKCGKKYQHTYNGRSLIRVEEMSESLQDTIMHIVDSSVSVESAKEAHAKAQISNVKRVKLPTSGIIVELYNQTAYDFINKQISELNELRDNKKYENAAVLSTIVRRAFVYDESDDSYFEIDGAVDITKLIYALPTDDLAILQQMGGKLLETGTIEYGLMDITCPHCGHYKATMPISIDELFFHRYLQAMNMIRE